MITVYHGSPNYFTKYDVSKAGEGSGKKYGIGINVSDVEDTAVHYSQPRGLPLTKDQDHYLYTMEMPELTDDNHLISKEPVATAIIKRAEKKLGKTVPTKYAQKGKEFRKWIGMALTGSDELGFEEEKASAKFLDEIGVLCLVWPRHQSKELLKPSDTLNYLVFNPEHVHIRKVEHIEIQRKGKKYVLVEGSRKVIYIDNETQQQTKE